MAKANKKSKKKQTRKKSKKNALSQAGKTGIHKTAQIKKWTDKDLKEFLKLYPDTDNKVLAKKFGRTPSAIAGKAADHLQTKSAAYFNKKKKAKDAKQKSSSVSAKKKSAAKSKTKQQKKGKPTRNDYSDIRTTQKTVGM